MTSRRYDTGRPPRPPQQNDAPQGPPRRRGRRWTKRAGQHRPSEEGRTAERETLPGGKARGHVDTRDLDPFLEGWVDDAPEAEETAEVEEEGGTDAESDG